MREPERRSGILMRRSTRAEASPGLGARIDLLNFQLLLVEDFYLTELQKVYLASSLALPKRSASKKIEN